MFFISCQMLILFLRYLNFRREFPHHMKENGLNKAKVNLKADETEWAKHNYNAHIAQYLNK